MPDIKGNNQKVYDFLSSKSVKGIGENADQFQQFMQKDENRRKVYDYLSSVKAQGIGDSYDEFSNLVYESKPDYSFSGSSFKSESPSNLVEVAPEPKQETAPAPAAKEPEYQPANFVESAPNVSEEAPAKPEEEKRPFTEEELIAMREQHDEDYRFAEEYARKEKEYQDHMRSLQNIRGNVQGLDDTVAKYRAEKEWLDQNKGRYEEAKGNVNDIEARNYNELVPAAMESLRAKRADNRQYMATPQETIVGGRTPFDRDEKNLHEKADDIYAKAEQALKQGSKYDPGYSGDSVDKFFTAFRQYLQGGINNVDKDTITMGLASGTAMAKARDAMEHNNALVDGALKKMGMADGDVAALMSTIATDTESLNTIVNDLDQRKGELDAMESTLKDMVSGKADRSKIEAYAKEYEKKVDEYNDIIKKDFNPAKEKYDRDNEDYKKVEETVAAALESGLSGGEKALLDAVQELTRANMLRANDVSTASKSGASFEQTLEFMLDFLLTKGLGKAGTKAATKLTARHLERKMGKEAFEYMAKREVIRPTVFAQAAMDIPVSLARTAVMFPRTIKAYGEHATEYSGKDPMGKFQLDRTKAEAFGNAVLEDFIEYWSEGFGEYFSAGEQALFRAATRNAPKTMIGRTLKAYQGSIGQFLDYGKFSGQLNETLEEVVGSGLNALAGLISDNRYGDKKALNDFFTKDNLATLTLSFLPLSAIGAATNISAYNRMKENYDNGVAGLEPFFKSGAISREELDNLAAGLNDLTPEEAAKKIADIEKRAAEKNNGALPKSFRDNIMGYLEGTFSMSLRNEEWENSKQKVEVATAYADTYNVQDVADAYDLNEDERTAREAAAEAGFTEDELDKDAWQLGMDAANLAAEDQERSQILQKYAVAKGANKGLADGYKANTDKMSKAYGDAVMDNVDVNGNVVTATVNVQGQDVPVFVISPDATVNADGTITTPTGTDGLVTFQQGLGGQTMTVKASQLSNAQAQATGDFIMQKQEDIQKGRAEDFKVAQDTMSARGKAKALSGMVGQQVYFEGGGVFQPLKIERIRDNGQTVVISGDRKALQGIARAMNISIPAATMLEAPSAALYDNLAKEQDGSITTDVPAERQQAAAEEVREEEAAPAEPAMDLNSVIDEDVDVELDGQKQKVHVLSVKDGTVTFSDETGRDRRMPESQFVTAMQGTQMPVEEAPVAEAQAETPAAEVSAEPAVAEAQRTPIPVDEKSGEKIYDAPGVPVHDALEDLYATEGLTEADVDQYIAERAAETEAARNPERGKMSPQAWGQAKKEAARVADFWAEMAKAAQERKAQPAAAEAPAAEAQAEAPVAEAPVAEQPAAPAEAESTPAQEAATATEETQAEEPTKETLRPYKKMVSRAKKWQKRTGIKVRLCTSLDEVNDADARAELEKGEKIAGWYDPETGGVGVYLPNISSEEQLDKTIVHEVVSHKGLKGMLGEEGYNALCDRVWKELMTRGDRAKYMRYVRHMSGSKEFLQRAAADEYIANLSENVDFSDNRNLFEKIVDYIAEWFKEKFGNESPLTEEEIIADAQARATDERRMTRLTLRNLLIDSMKLYEARTREGQDEANERREISANTGGSMETGKGKKNSTKFSIVSTVSGVGMNVIENDGTGRVAFEMPDGRRFDADHPITAEDISSMPDTVMSYMMEDAVEIAHLKPEAVQRIWQAYADQLNAFLRKGVPTNGMTGEQILKNLWEWEVENTVYRSVSPNGDKQYSYSIDITRVCKKNEAVIRAISSMQKKVGYGLTPGQIMDIYMEGVEEGYQVPCPVCYVFSHYINNGIVATVAINGQEKWGADLVDPATLSEEEKQARIQMWYDRLKKQGEENAANAKEIEAAKEDCKMIIEEINEISELVTSGRLTGKDRTEALRRVKVLDNRYRSAFEVLSQSGLTQWVKQFAIREAKKGETGFVPKGQPKGEEPKAYVLWEDTFQGFPKEYALDLRLTAETIEKYPAIQRMRNARGSAGGKEIHFASNNDIGDIPMMLGADNKDNYYQQAVKAQGAEREELRKKARERFASAHRYAQQQSLRGGQRMWSWSDNIERLAPDVFANLMQLQMLGGALQAYSKQLEGVNLVASMGGYVNGSLMGYGKGWQELRDDEVKTLPDGGMVLAHDIMDPVIEKVDGKDVPRDRYLAKAGAPVFEIDGKKVTLLLDDVVGIDAYGRETEDGGHLKGLFDLNAELDKAGNIIVGMNDTHVRNAMADGRIFFIIPWHASGNSVHVVQQMLGYLGVKTNLKDYTDYTDVQEEKDLKGKEVSDYVAKFWEDTFQNGGKDFACGIEEGIPSGKDGKLSPEQEHYRELRDAIFLGIKYDTLKTTKKGNKVYDTISVRDLINLVASVEAGEQEMPAWLKADPRELYKWAAQIQNDAFLSQALSKVEARVDEQKMTKTDTGFIYPYEYWDEQSTYDTADVNGTRYLEYCRRLGVKPKFVGMLDGRAPEKDFGNFAKDKGYWKLLIDRRMYDVNGRFQDLDPVTTNEYDPKFVDPQWTEQNFTKTQVADDEGAERIADKVIEREGATLPGGVPQANYSTDLKTAARKYRALTGMAKRPSIQDLVAAATPEAVFGQNRDEGGTMMRRVEDPAKIAELENGPKVKVYRSMQFVPNPDGDVEYDLGDGNGLQKGFLYAPMSAKVNGKWRDPIHLGEWEEAEENPDLADENGDFWLDKADGSEPMKVAYAPYLHTRLSPLNEQFSSAYKRWNLVIVESEVPESELKSGYTAEKSKKSTGEHDWPSGKVSNALAKEGMDTRKVILSRWAKPTRLVPTSEVADKIADLIGDRDIAFPYNVVTPGLRQELVKRGVKFDGWQGNKPNNVDELIAGMKAENERAAGQTSFRRIDEDRDEARQREQMDEGLHNTMANRGIELTKKDIAEGKKLSREDPGMKIRLGLPGGSLMEAGVRDQQIVISEYDLVEASGNGYGDKHSYHPFDLDDLKDLASLINHPIAVFRSKKNPYTRVLLLDKKGYILDRKETGKHNYVAVIASMPVIDEGGYTVKDANGNRLYENRILTSYPSDTGWKSLYAQLKELGQGVTRPGQDVMWVDNKKISSWVKEHASTVRTYDTITQEDIAKIQKDFENKQDLLRIDAENSRPGRNTRYRRVSEGDSKEARIESAEWDVTERNLDAMGHAFGVKVNRVSREDMPKGHKTEKGYFDASNDELTICMDNVLDERDALATMIHETVGYNGLRELFGDQFQQDMVNIYAALNPEGRTWVNAYIARNGLVPGDAAIVDGMIEYMANLAEKADPNDTVWNRINELLGKSVDIVYGTEGFEFTNRELAYVLRAANEYAKNPEWLNTTEGKAKDTLWKRELGINESNPDRPTDPDGPGAGTRYRRVETGNAVTDYEEEMKQTGTIIQMEFQDADLPIKIGVEKIMREKGRLTKDAKGNLVLEKLPDDEDYVTRHNQASSRADTEAKEYELFFFQPLLEKIKDIQRKLADGKTDAESMHDAYDRILDYLYAMSGLERNEWERANGGEKKDWSGITSLMKRPKEEWREAEADARAMVDRFKKDVGDDAMLDDLWDAIRACSDFTLDHAYKYELLTKKEYEELRGTDTKPRMWDYYLPLRGFKGGTVEDEYNYSSFKNGTNGTEVNKEAKGRWTEAENPIANLYHIALSEIVQGNENWAKQALYNFVLGVGDNSLLEIVNPWYMEDPSSGNWVAVYPNPNESYKDFEARMQEERKKGKAIQPKKELKLNKPMANPIHKQEHIIKLKIGGQDRSVMVNGNNAIARAVMHNWKTNYQNLRRASRVISNLFTTYSINFSGKNLFRDTIYSMVSRYIKEDKAYRKAYRKNWWKNFGHGAFAYPMVRLAKQWEDGTLQQKQNPTLREQTFMDFMRDGGQTGYTIVQKVQDITRNIEREMKYAGKKRAFRNEQGQVTIPILSHFADLVSTLNEGFELLTRFTTYQTSREMGRTGQRSASDAKEVSVNFNRRGMQSGEGFWGNAAAWFGASHYFFNASVQGFENFLRLFKIDRPKMTGITTGFALLGMATPFINSMIEAALGGDDGDDDWYWNIPDWVRRNNIIIGGHKFYLAIPLPVELRAFYGIGDLIAKAFPYNKMADRTAGHFMLELVNTLGEIMPINPVEGSQQIKDIGDWKSMADAAARILMPDITTFAIDFATNRNYTGTPLAKENPFSGTTPRSQGAFASTPKALEDACMWLAMHTGADFPPGYVRDFLNSFGGGLYRTAEDLSKILYRDEERPFRWDNIPFFSGFMGHIDQDRSNAHALEVLQEYGDMSDGIVREINRRTGLSFTTSDVYDDPEALLQSLKPSRQAVVKRIMDSPEYEIGRTYREYMNNKYKMVQYTRGPKIGQWHEDKKQIERVGIKKLKQDWKAARAEWYSLPKGSPEKAEAYADLQTAWQKYYDATMDLSEKLMDIEFDRK